MTTPDFKTIAQDLHKQLHLVQDKEFPNRCFELICAALETAFNDGKAQEIRNSAGLICDLRVELEQGRKMARRAWK